MTNRMNHNRLLESLVAALLAWHEGVADENKLMLPWMGHETVEHMAVAALAVLDACGDLRASLIEDGEMKEQS